MAEPPLLCVKDALSLSILATVAALSCGRDAIQRAYLTALQPAHVFGRGGDGGRGRKFLLVAADERALAVKTFVSLAFVGDAFGGCAGRGRGSQSFWPARSKGCLLRSESRIIPTVSTIDSVH